uniref:Uncharacterized protein n=1 Tax=Tetranychus urticae TaxID=32264 RepID=T1JY11_TETUR
MNGTESLLAYRSGSASKKWLTGILSFFVALDFIFLILGIVESSAFRIVASLISLTIDGVIFTATIKEWKDVLKVGRIYFIVVIVLGIFILLLASIAIDHDGKLPKEKKESLIFSFVFVIFYEPIAGFAVVLIGRYLAEMENASSA